MEEPCQVAIGNVVFAEGHEEHEDHEYNYTPVTDSEDGGDHENIRIVPVSSVVVKNASKF